MDVLSPYDVEAIRARYKGTQIAALAVSHERLRAMFEEACERIQKQSDLLTAASERADRKAGRVSQTVHV